MTMGDAVLLAKCRLNAFGIRITGRSIYINFISNRFAYCCCYNAAQRINNLSARRNGTSKFVVQINDEILVFCFFRSFIGRQSPFRLPQIISFGSDFFFRIIFDYFRRRWMKQLDHRRLIVGRIQWMSPLFIQIFVFPNIEHSSWIDFHSIEQKLKIKIHYKLTLSEM